MHHWPRQILKRFILTTFTGLFLFMQTAQTANYITFIHTDVLGSPVAVTDQNGNIVSREHVSPYGDSLGMRSADDTNPVGSSEHSLGYTGHVKDKDLGLTYMQARYYDPTIGRFMGVDPVGFRDTQPALFNRYAYANNNPYKYVDPDGEFAFLAIPVALTAFEWSIVAVTGLLALGAVAENVQPVLSEEDKVKESQPKGKDNAPNSTLPRDESGNYLPDDEASGAHTTLGTRNKDKKDKKEYTQGATFDENGEFQGRTDVTDHNRKNHENPHFHPPTGPNRVGPAQEISDLNSTND